MADMQIIAEGTGANPTELAAADASLKIGAEAELRIFVSTAPSTEVLKQLEMELISGGMVLRDNVRYDSGIVVIRYVKTAEPAPTSVGFPLAIVAIGVLALAGGIFGWQLAGKTESILSNPYLIIGAGVMLIIYLIMKPQRQEE